MRIQLTLTQYLFCFFLALFSFSSCKKTLEEERTFSENKSIENFIKGKNYSLVEGVYHVINIPSFGYQVSTGDTVKFLYKGYTLDGRVFDTNVKSVAKSAKLDTLIRSFDPIITIAGNGELIKGLDQGLLQMREGEFATILFASPLGFGDNAVGPVESWSPLAYDVELLSVNSVSIQNEKNYIHSLNLGTEGFLDDPKSGLYYKEIYSELGSSPTIKDTIYGWYIGWCKGSLSDSTIIDEINTDNKQIVLSSEDLPEGVRLGFMLTKTKGITELVLPSYLGFGNKGNELIKPYQTVFYRIRLDSIK